MTTNIFFQDQAEEFTNIYTLPIQNYKFVSIIGKGAFSTVILVKTKLDNKYYAMKIMKKKRILETGFTENILTQKAILSNIDHPFMVKLKESFQDSQKLYLVMDYCPGGELLGLLQTADKLGEQQAKFYAAQVLLVLEKLHQKKIIYRDLKPENILLDAKGYLKITDFGLSKALYEDQEKALSICGTPEYFTPEMIKRKGHNQSVDWWCFGCLLYEMVVGMPPFIQKNRSALFDKILYEPINLPPQVLTFFYSKISPELKDLLTNLLKKDPIERLGANGAAEVKCHMWFKNVNFSHVLSRSIKPPFVPVIHSEEDVSNFSKQFTKASMSAFEEKYSMVDEEEEELHFQGFDFGGNSRDELE